MEVLKSGCEIVDIFTKATSKYTKVTWLEVFCRLSLQLAKIRCHALFWGELLVR